MVLCPDAALSASNLRPRSALAQRSISSSGSTLRRSSSMPQLAVSNSSNTVLCGSSISSRRLSRSASPVQVDSDLTLPLLPVLGLSSPRSHISVHDSVSSLPGSPLPSAPASPHVSILKAQMLADEFKQQALFAALSTSTAEAADGSALLVQEAAEGSMTQAEAAAGGDSMADVLAAPEGSVVEPKPAARPAIAAAATARPAKPVRKFKYEYKPVFGRTTKVKVYL